MSRKYVPPVKKRKSHSVTHTRDLVTEQTVPEVEPELTVSYAPAAKVTQAPVPVSAQEAVLHSSLPKELIRLGLLSALAIAIMIALYFIFR